MNTNIIIYGLTATPTMFSKDSSQLSLHTNAISFFPTPAQIFQQYCSNLPTSTLSQFNIYINNALTSQHNTPVSTFSHLYASTAFKDLSIQFIPKIYGGKGGFGNNLRGVGAKKKRVPHDDGMMRSQTGQRLADQRNTRLLEDYERQLREGNRSQGRDYLNAGLRVTTQPNRSATTTTSQAPPRQLNSFSALQKITPSASSALCSDKQDRFDDSIVQDVNSIKKALDIGREHTYGSSSDLQNDQSSNSPSLSQSSSSSKEQNVTINITNPPLSPQSDPTLSVLKAAVENMAQVCTETPISFPSGLSKKTVVSKTIKITKDDHGLDLSSDDDSDEDDSDIDE